jgi:hypothetical protein
MFATLASTKAKSERTMNVNDYIKNNRQSNFRPCPRIVCVDGFSMSVQASEYTYCCPRNNTGPYISMEVGFPSEKVEKLMPYAEDENQPTDTVYAYVPVEIIEQVISNHGGMVNQ